MFSLLTEVFEMFSELMILRMIRGYVDFSVSGKYPERFLNSAFKSGVKIWSQKSSGGKVTAKMYVGDYKRCRTKARKTGVRLKVLKRHGLPFFVHKNKNRAGLLVGAAVFFIMIFFMSSFVWTIDMEGVSNISENEIRTLLKDCGVYEGAWSSSIDVQWAKRQLSHKYPMITWSAINIYGSNVDVIVKEGQEKNKPDISTPANIVAEKDGFIIAMETRDGTNLVTLGQSVLEGELLVSSAIEIEGQETRFVRAQSKITAQTTEITEFSADKNIELITSREEAVSRLGISFYGADFPVTLNQIDGINYYRVLEENCLVLNGVSLPISLISEKNYVYEKTQVERTDEMIDKALEIKEALYETFQMQDAVITGRNVYESSEEGKTVRKNAYSCIEDIALTSPLEIEQ